MTELPLTVKEHPRARNVLVKLVPGRGLEVVVPKGYDQGRVPEVLRRKQGWIERARRTMEAEGIQLLPRLEPPDAIRFRALGVERRVDYLHKSAKPKITENAGRLLVSGDTEDTSGMLVALRKYVVGQARLHLPPWLGQVSQRTGLAYESVRIRTQKTRWGSCSVQGVINLNAKLLFLPPALVEHLFLHELCHRKHMNHSPAYWQLVESFQPDYAHLENALRNGSRHVPGWISLSAPLV